MSVELIASCIFAGGGNKCEGIKLIIGRRIQKTTYLLCANKTTDHIHP